MVSLSKEITLPYLLLSRVTASVSAKIVSARIFPDNIIDRFGFHSCAWAMHPIMIAVPFTKRLHSTASRWISLYRNLNRPMADISSRFFVAHAGQGVRG